MGKTLYELSRELGVSTATLSRVLNGDSHVSAATRERILAALEGQGYAPRRRQRSVAKQNADTVLVIVGQLNNPILMGYIEGIRRHLTESGRRCLIALSDYNTETECELVRYAETGGYAGALMLNAVESEQLVALISEQRLPLVLVNRFLRTVDTDVVTLDNYRSGYMATQYLISYGHSRIAHLAGPESSITCRMRRQGYLDALHEAGLQPDPQLMLYGDRTYPGGYAAGQRIAARRGDCTAVFAATALMAMGMVAALNDAGLRVPEDISVICNDDYSRELMPGGGELTCVRHDAPLVGDTAARMLIERICEPTLRPRRVVFPPELHERASVRRV